jgi:hypothetical protein
MLVGVDEPEPGGCQGAAVPGLLDRQGVRCGIETFPDDATGSSPRAFGGWASDIERVEYDEDIEVAVLHLRENVDGLVAAHVIDRLAWQVESRPRANDPRLTGVVSDTGRRFSKARGPDINVIQLLVDQTVREFEGHSGSPVVLRRHPRLPRLADPPGTVAEVLHRLHHHRRHRYRDRQTPRHRLDPRLRRATPTMARRLGRRAHRPARQCPVDH